MNKPKDQSASLERFRKFYREQHPNIDWSKAANPTVVESNLEYFLSKELSLAEQRGREEAQKDFFKFVLDTRSSYPKSKNQEDHEAQIRGVNYGVQQVKEQMIDYLRSYLKKGNQTL